MTSPGSPSRAARRRLALLLALSLLWLGSLAAWHAVLHHAGAPRDGSVAHALFAHEAGGAACEGFNHLGLGMAAVAGQVPAVDGGPSQALPLPAASPARGERRARRHLVRAPPEAPTQITG